MTTCVRVVWRAAAVFSVVACSSEATPPDPGLSRDAGHGSGGGTSSGGLGGGLPGGGANVASGGNAGGGAPNGGATGSSGGNTASGGAASGGATGGKGLLSDPTVPTCTASGDADVQIRGTLDGRAVSFQPFPTSYLEQGLLQVLGTYHTDAGYVARTNVEFRWSRSLSPGVETPLDGGSFYLPEDQPGGGKFYCFSSGAIAPSSDATQNGTGRLFRFRMQVLSGNEDCSGGPVAGELTGCIHRLLPESD